MVASSHMHILFCVAYVSSVLHFWCFLRKISDGVVQLWREVHEVISCYSRSWFWIPVWISWLFQRPSKSTLFFHFSTWWFSLFCLVHEVLWCFIAVISFMILADFENSYMYVQAMPNFFCKNCQYKQHQCFSCGELGSSDKLSGAEVWFLLKSWTIYLMSTVHISELN